MILILWVVVFVVSLVALVKGADWLLVKSEKIGLALGLSSFIVGVLIVGAGTSLPELVSSLVAIFKGAPEIVAANAIGSNIANILLILGLSAVIGRRLLVVKNIINLDLPLLAASTALFGVIAWDRQITSLEAILLLIGYIVYITYTIVQKDEDENGNPIVEDKNIVKEEKPKLVFKDFAILILGLAGVIFGAQYLIESVIQISTILQIGAGVIAITAVAIGTSLPELLVSIKAILKGKSELAIGNIFGSNIFNILVVVGIPGLFKILPLDNSTFAIGLPIMLVATLLFVISGISRKIYIWDGAFYVCIYIFFIGKLFNLF